MIPTSWPDLVDSGRLGGRREKQRFVRPESVKAPRSPTDMIIAPDGLSGATNAGRLVSVDLWGVESLRVEG